MANHVEPSAEPTAAQPAVPGPAPAPDTVPETAEEAVEGILSAVRPALDYIQTSAAWFADIYLSWDGLLRLAIIAGAGILAWYLSKPVKSFLARIWPKGKEVETRRSYVVVSRIVHPILWSMLLWIATGVLGSMGKHNDLLRLAASLLNAWWVIRLFSGFVRDPAMSKTFAFFAWTIAALNILKLLNPAIALLDRVAMTVGDTRLSLYMVIKGGIIAFVLLWAANVLTALIQGRVQRSKSLTPSMQTLIGQAVRLALLFGAIILALNVIGIDLTALAVFSGAVGIGIGFGLQAIFSNLVAGIIMLFEGSVKVGDFVELDNDLTGEVREINIRSTRVATNDNVDILVPNSEFINNRVTNWTLRESFRRVRIPFGVAYGTDRALVVKAALEAAATQPHELKGPDARPAQVWLTGFGDNSVDFALVVWLCPESVKRPGKVVSDYNWALAEALDRHGIEIPFPQRDLHIRSGQLPVRIDNRTEEEA